MQRLNGRRLLLEHHLEEDPIDADHKNERSKEVNERQSERDVAHERAKLALAHHDDKDAQKRFRRCGGEGLSHAVYDSFSTRNDTIPLSGDTPIIRPVTMAGVMRSAAPERKHCSAVSAHSKAGVPCTATST